MKNQYEINEMAKEESWRMFRIIGELVEGFDTLADIVPAVTVYGSARLKPEDPLYEQVEDIAFRLGKAGFSIMTGGGPGVMEAANKGAREAGVKSVGLNIKLPEEQLCNAYADRSITFHHFFVRKVMLVKYATAFIIMPGGLGTLDELTEVLTLIQTEKIKPFPVILYSSEYWNGLLDWLRETVLARGAISPEDFELLRVFDSPDEVVDAVQKWYRNQEVTGRKALAR
ncbi:MAG TPA: TIGR00730 family Rossman fold protein [Dehalococcoidales bacterium]|nr:TIGR00730 family Rossman fold protein [Dehalococcoidales bacterium]